MQGGGNAAGMRGHSLQMRPFSQRNRKLMRMRIGRVVWVT